MPNPAASPAVSSTVGLKNMVIAPLTVDTEETLTYGALQLVAGAIEASITPQNADPDVQTDMEAIFNNLVKEREPYYEHTCEGDDDMPAHAKSTIVGAELTIPITNGRMNMGIWQGIYLCEFRNRGGGRKIVATIIG